MLFAPGSPSRARLRIKDRHLRLPPACRASHLPLLSQESSRRILSDQIKEVLDELNPKERRILEMRYGLLDGIQHTLERVGEEFGVTRERIRQIEAKVHEKLRQHDKISRLKNYFD